MATLPPVKLEQLINGTWVDMAATPARLDGEPARSRVLWSESGGPVEIVRGVGEGGTVASGTMDCVLENNDGALTRKKATSPWYPYLVKGRKVRFSSYFGGAWRPRFTGYVWAEPLAWANENATACNVRLSAIDALGMAYKPLRSVAVEATAERNPLAYWPLTDTETAEASDQSAYSRPGLAMQQYKTEGEIGWAAGVVLPTDSAGGVVFTPTSNGGLYLRSTGAIDLPASWSLSVFPTPAAKDGYLVQVGTDSYSIGIWYDTSSKKFSAIETKLDSSGDPVDYVLSTSTSAWAGGMETLTVTATTVKLGSSGTTGTRHNSVTMLGSLVSVGGALAVESGRARLYSGEAKHLAIWSGAVPSGLSSDTLTGPAAMLTMSTAIAKLMGWAGYPVSVSVLGTDRAVQLLKTDSQNAPDLIGQLAQGSMAQIFCAGDGNIVVNGWDYFPAAITAPAGDIDPEVEWGADSEAQTSGATMTWPDGATYTVGESGGLEIPGVLTQAAGKGVAEWLAASTDRAAPRFPDAPYSLLTMSDAEAAALAVADVGSVLVIPGLPGQLPATSQTSIVDSIVETYGADVWSMAFATSPDPRDDLLIVGDATKGKVSDGRLAAPLGPDAGAGQWLAGEEVTHTKLNATGWQGGEVQVGSVTVTTTAADTPASQTVTFPVAFATTPQVMVTPDTTQVGSIVLGWGATGVTTTGFTAWVTCDRAIAVGTQWVAVTD